jgi:hypothetical protein
MLSLWKRFIAVAALAIAAMGGIAVPASASTASPGAAGQAMDCDIFMCGSNHNQLLL